VAGAPLPTGMGLGLERGRAGGAEAHLRGEVPVEAGIGEEAALKRRIIILVHILRVGGSCGPHRG
jgi:hypothetical protein